MEYFKSNGKLLLTGEYLVLKGAQSLALPLKYGQTMQVSDSHRSSIEWSSCSLDGQIWFEAMWDTQSGTIRCSQTEIGERLGQLLTLAFEHADKSLGSQGYKVETKLEFERSWGWGSSSTLIDLIAQWLDIDPFYLAKKSFGGSGYDIACARSSGPILYDLKDKKPSYRRVTFDPSFKDQIYFVHLGIKRDTRKALAEFDHSKTYHKEVELLNEFTTSLLSDISYEDFCTTIVDHEELISEILKKERIGLTLFGDFQGVTKSLGGWGGDFIMATSKESREYVIDYFKQKGYSTIFHYSEIVL